MVYMISLKRTIGPFTESSGSISLAELGGGRLPTSYLGTEMSPAVEDEQAHNVSNIATV